MEIGGYEYKVKYLVDGEDKGAHLFGDLLGCEKFSDKNAHRWPTTFKAKRRKGGGIQWKPAYEYEGPRNHSGHTMLPEAALVEVSEAVKCNILDQRLNRYKKGDTIIGQMRSASNEAAREAKRKEFEAVTGLKIARS